MTVIQMSPERLEQIKKRLLSEGYGWVHDSGFPYAVVFYRGSRFNYNVFLKRLDWKYEWEEARERFNKQKERTR